MRNIAREPIIQTKNDNQRTSLCIHEVFEARVQEAPDAVAVSCEGESLSYQQLNERSNQLGHYLRNLGVRREKPVGIYVERSLEMVIGLLGILKAGGAYVPLEPTYPRERIAFMLEDSQAELLLTQEQIAGRLPETCPHLVRLDSDWKSIAEQPKNNIDRAVTSENLAYAIYTSGSTGKPKGVEVTHCSVVHLFAATHRLFAFEGTDVWTVAHSYAFDFSVWDIFGPLLSGGRLVIVPLRVSQSPLDFQQLLRREQVTVLSHTPAALRQLVQLRKQVASREADWNVRLVVCGGDAFPSDLVPGLLGWNVPIWNFYGPTESTVWATIKKVEAADVDYNTVPVGRPLADLESYLLDEGLQPVTGGRAGELYLGGAGLARGYFKRPELTAEKFIPHPFSEGPGERLYKTGDLGRYLPDGNIEHLGRIDYQVKVRGFRVELEEIEAILGQHAAVEQCVVLIREEQPGDQRLVAYIVPRLNQRPKTSELLELAQAKLPEYMAPAAFVFLEGFPLTANGKVDRRSLPAPAPTRPDLKEDFVAPQTATEDLLADIWASVLCLDRVGANDNFFELGGHSLLATKAISRIRDAFHVDLPLTNIFEAPTVARLSRVIDRAKDDDATSPSLSIRPVPRTGNLPVTFPQERVWFIQQLFPETLAYNFQSTLRFRGPLDLSVVERSLNEIVRRHEIYRTTFPAIEGVPIQVIHEPQPVKLKLIDLAPLPENERANAADRHVNEELQERFDPTKLPLIRWIALRFSEDEHLLLHVEHHLVHDGWSFNIFLNDFLELYRAFSAGQSSPLPELPVQFADFAVWQRQWMQGDVARIQLDFWTEKLAGSSPTVELPTDRPRPAVQSLRGTSRRLELPLELCEALRKFGREEGVTLFMALLAAFEVLLYRLSGQTDFCVGSGIANRRWPETETMIGMLVNTIALRADLSDVPSFRELLGRVRNTALEAYTHQDLPFDRLVDAVKRDRDLSRNPLFQIMFNFHDAPLPALELPGIDVDLVEVVSNQTSKFDLNVIVIPRSEQHAGSGSKTGPEGITVIWEYNTDIFDEATILRFESLYRKLLTSVIAHPERSIAEMPLVTGVERQYLLSKWSGEKAEFPRESCIHNLFEEQAERTPGATAIVFGDSEVSYGELNRRANQLARHLERCGVGPDLLVGVSLERSIEMIVGLLGILKAGGAYVPLDPSYPQERLKLMLDDCRVAALITDEKFSEKFPSYAGRLVCIDKDRPEISKHAPENTNRKIKAENLAYVIYTSGSTGKPKGVCVAHRSVIRLVRNTTYATFKPEEVFLQFAPVSFDASTFEIWGSLLNGARLVVMPPGPASLGELGAALRLHKVTTLWLSAGLFQQMVDAQMANLRGLDQLLAGGDVLSVKHVEKVVRELENCKLINGYGPTENTTFTCCYETSPGERFSTSVPIGRPIINTQVYILDSTFEPVPVGVVGSLYIGGEGLARGYLNDEAMTAEKFVPNPFSEDPGARLYRTGDLARYGSDGNIQFLGRVDQQIKLRGYRIELGEIEAVLAKHEAVRECAVIDREDTPGDKRLAAYVVSVQNKQEVDSSQLAGSLRQFLRQKLPDYMVPGSFAFLDKLPLTENGKLDRRALPVPVGTTSRAPFIEPRTPIEEELTEIWASILKLSRLGVHDNFFDLGGHSLLATQVISRVRDAFQTEVPLRRIFEGPTVAELAQAINDAKNKATDLPIPGIKARPRLPRRS